MVSRFHRGLALLSCALALQLISSAQAANNVYPAAEFYYPTTPCSVTVSIPIRGQLSTPCKELRFAYLLDDDLPLVGDDHSYFTGRISRGADVPESLLESVAVVLNQDSTIAMVRLVTRAPFTAGPYSHLADIEVYAEIRHACVAITFYPDTLFDGTSAVLIDSANTPQPLEAQWGWFQTIFDEPYPPPPEAVYGSYAEVKRAREDTTVTMSISCYAWQPYASLSIPIRIKPTGVSAYIVPGSIVPTESAGTNLALTAFPDSTGFWLEFSGCPGGCRGPGQPNTPETIVRFDVALSGAATGTVVIDTARFAGGQPLQFVDDCPNAYLPAFGRGRVDVGAVSVWSEDVARPSSFELLDPYPNPFNAATTIGVSLSEPAWIRIEIVNLLGQQIDVLWDGRLAAGAQEFVWTAPRAASGLYLARVRNDVESKTAKLLLLK